MKAAVIVFPGSNCDRDIQVSLRKSMGKEPLMVWHQNTSFDKVDLITIPGGYSYGDYLRAGAMASKSPVMQEIIARANKGVPVLGICNGFQILTESGLLPGVLMRNSALKYICKDIYLRVEVDDTVFTLGYNAGDVLRIPIAHHDGNYFAVSDTIDLLENDNRVAFRYTNDQGEETDTSNPNGSQHNIAGILSEGRNVLGMMPHPERLADAALGGDDGKRMFDGLIAALG